VHAALGNQGKINPEVTITWKLDTLLRENTLQMRWTAAVVLYVQIAID
jgi:hypothetical protein